MKYEGWDYLDHMVQACDELTECMNGIHSVQDLKKSVLTRRAVTMCLLDLGELFKSLTTEEKAEYQSNNWQHVIGFRNRAAHGYHDLDFGIIFDIVVNIVPPLSRFLKEKQKTRGDDNV
ncbi:MAG: DUF86 domain-containing protein [Defluviitaleaceae bacterium]|nr:DUF86 domain-containing protein [Defluviitaleaceae bacterium]